MMRCLAGLILVLFQPIMFSDITPEHVSTQLTTDIPVLAINGAIGPAVADYLIRSIKQFNQQGNTPLIIITLDTPGGLSSSLRDINQAILNSQIPIACLVHPQGARAASAGTYILYACHIAAMAPATTLGAATPVSITGPATPAATAPDDKEQNTGGTAMERKVLNDSIAYIRSLAQLRQRNADWAELAVREAATLTAIEALEKNVINYLANSAKDLLIKLHGKTIEVDGKIQMLKLEKSSLHFEKPDWRTEFIATITDPNIAYILMLLGFYGILLEFYSPGIGISGVIGAIALIVALYAFQLLPVNFAGMLLIFLGIGLMITESMIPSFGIFGFGGLVSFVIGSIFLIDSDLQQFRVALPLIAAVSVVTALFILFMLSYLWRARHQKTVSGREAIIGAEGLVIYDFMGDGSVTLDGESWAAHSTQQLQKGQSVTIRELNGLILTVEKNNKEQDDE